MSSLFVVGQLVQVESRTRPGINQPGGVARITAVYYSSPLPLLNDANGEADPNWKPTKIWIDVKYVLDGRTEHRLLVDDRDRGARGILKDDAHGLNSDQKGDSCLVEVQAYHQAPSRSLRNRQLLLGRCVRCGSLRKDCQSCDWLTLDSVLPTGAVPSGMQSIGTASRHQSPFVSRRTTKRRRTFNTMSVLEKIGQETETDSPEKPTVYAKSARFHSAFDISSDEDELSRKTTRIGTAQSLPTRGFSFDAESSDEPTESTNTDDSVLTSESDNDYKIDLKYIRNEQLNSASLSNAGRTHDIQSNDDGFIVPEGDASMLPVDCSDFTVQVPHSELPDFFDECYNKVKKTLIPLFKARVTLLEMEHRRIDRQKDEKLVNQNISSLSNRCQVAHDEIIQEVIRAGIDQCKQALRKMCSSRMYRSQAESMTKVQRIKYRRDLEIRELNLDDLSSKVEVIISRLRKVMFALEERVDEATHSASDDSDSGWAQPCDTQAQEHEFVDSRCKNKSIFNEHELPPFQAHPFATVKRDNLASDIARYRITSKEHSPKETPIEIGNTSAMNRRNVTVSNSGLKRPNRRESDNLRSNEIRVLETNIQGDNDLDRVVDVILSNNEHRKQSKSKMERALALLQSEQIISFRPERHKGGKLSIAERMELFLDANNLGQNIHTENEQIEYNLGVPVRRRHLNNTGTLLPLQELRPSSRSVERLEIDRSFFFHRLRRNSTVSCTEQEAFDLESTVKNMSDICSQLIDTFPYGDYQHPLACLVQSPTLASISNDEKVLVFGTILKCLMVDDGWVTLPELLSRDGYRFRAYVNLFATILRLLRAKVNSGLNDDSGVIYEIFADNGHATFLSWVVLQFVDVLYALFTPAAWALNVRCPERFLEELEVLRDELAFQFHLLERISTVITEDMEPQKWRFSLHQDHVYCSSVDPANWQSFLKNACHHPPRMIETRLSSFVDFLPQQEIDALWGILGYLANSPVKTDLHNEGQARWKIIEIIFTKGSCCIPSDFDETHPPGSSQLDAAFYDLTCFGDLIMSGTLDGLPGNDTLLTNIVERSIMLQRHSFQRDVHATEYQIARDEPLMMRVARKFWSFSVGLLQLEKITHPSESLDSLARIALLETAQNDDPLGMLDFFPASNISRASLALIYAWSSRIPRRRVRLNRFLNSLKSLANRLADKFKGANPTSASTPVTFASIFSTGETFTDGRAVSSIYCHEIAGYINLIASLLGHELIDATKLPNVHSSPTLAEKLWASVSDDNMKSRRLGECINEMAHSDSLQLHSTAKLMAWIGLESLGVVPWTVNLSNNTVCIKAKCDSRNTEAIYAFSCLLACLQCSVDQDAFDVTASILSRTFAFVLAMKTVNSKFNDSESCSSQLLWQTFSQVLTKFLAVPNVGPAESISFIVLLSLIRMWMTSVSVPDVGGLVGNTDDAFLPAPIDGDHLPSDSRLRVCALLLHALKLSVPSQRFAIESIADTSNLFPILSSAVRGDVARESNLICCCIASLCVTQGGTAFDVSYELIWNRFYSTFYSDKSSTSADYSFSAQLAYAFSVELWRLVKPSPACARLIQRTGYDHLNILFGRALELKSLFHFPSSNTSRIRINGGMKAETKELRLIAKLSESTSMREEVDEHWMYVANVGSAFRSCHSDYFITRIGRVLEQSQLAYSVDRTRVANSIELESARRTTMAAILIKETTMTSFTNWNHSAIIFFLIVRMGNQIIDQIARLCDHESLGDHYKYAKSIETTTCVIESHFSLVSWVVRQQQTADCCLPDVWTSYCERFLTPLLVGNNDQQAIDALRQLTKSRSTSILSPQLKLRICDMLRWSILRRSREYIVYLAREKAMTPSRNSMRCALALFDGFLEAATQDDELAARLVGRAFCLKPNYLLDAENHGRTPMESLLDDFFVSEGRRGPLHRLDIVALRKLWCYGLSSRLLPRLRSWRTGGASRVSILLFIQVVFENTDTKLTKSDFDDFPQNLPLYCELFRGIMVCLRYALIGRFQVGECNTEISERDSDFMNFNLVAAVFKCAETITKIPACSVDRDAAGSLLDWARTKYIDEEVLQQLNNLESRPDLSTIDTSAAYIWTSVQWLLELCQFFRSTSCVDDEGRSTRDAKYQVGHEYARRLYGFHATNESRIDEWEPIEARNECHRGAKNEMNSMMVENVLVTCVDRYHMWSRVLFPTTTRAVTPAVTTVINMYQRRRQDGNVRDHHHTIRDGMIVDPRNRSLAEENGNESTSQTPLMISCPNHESDAHRCRALHYMECFLKEVAPLLLQ